MGVTVLNAWLTAKICEHARVVRVKTSLNPQTTPSNDSHPAVIYHPALSRSICEIRFCTTVTRSTYIDKVAFSAVNVRSIAWILSRDQKKAAQDRFPCLAMGKRSSNTLWPISLGRKP